MMKRNTGKIMIMIMKVVMMLIMMISGSRSQFDESEPIEVIAFKPNPEIYSLQITSEITSRFATTHVTSYMINHANKAKEAVFNVHLPSSAFITNFIMNIGGRNYSGSVKEKLQTLSKNQQAGDESQKARNTQAFKVTVSIAANSKISFSLSYEELLQRRLGMYEHVINIDPQQIVQDLRVTVHIKEAKNIRLLTVPPLRRDVNELIQSGTANSLATIEIVNPNHAVVTFNPTSDQQRAISERGIAGQFVVNYDVQRYMDAGELQVVDRHFVHFFAPAELESLPKDIIFIIDSSGSMGGDKMEKTKQAMSQILMNLQPNDQFTVIDFDNRYKFWQEQLLPATDRNKQDAINFVNGMEASGGTNILTPLTEAIRVLLRHREQNPTKWSTRTPMIIFLTDGKGKRSELTIEKIRELNKDGIALFTLAYGKEADFQFLQQLSLQNNGFARQIYEDSDAAQQLYAFYNEIASPVLTDINIQYINDAVDKETLTKTNFKDFFQDSEIVVTGRLTDRILSLLTGISASGAQGDMKLELDAMAHFNLKERSELSRVTERIWAYLTIKMLLDQIKESEDVRVKENAAERVLELSLKYNFVTPLTSMVVTKPGDPGKIIGFGDDDDESFGFLAAEGRSVASRTTIIQPPVQPGPTRPAAPVRRPSPGGNPFVDNDPHFIVQVQGLREGVCFDVMGKHGNIYQLVHDPHTGVTVNAEVISRNGQPPKVKGHIKTWLGKIAIMCSSTLQVFFTPEKIKINSLSPHTWKKGKFFSMDHSHIKGMGRNKVSITCGVGMKFIVLKHNVHTKTHPEKVNFLGFYVHQGNGFSYQTHGLIGQFLHQSVKVAPPEIPLRVFSAANDSITFDLELIGPHSSGHPVKAHFSKRRNLEIKKAEPCWFVKNNGAGLIEGKVKDYLVPSLGYDGASKHHKTPMKKLHIMSDN